MKKKWMLLGVCILIVGCGFWFVGKDRETPEKEPVQETVTEQKETDREAITEETEETESMGGEETDRGEAFGSEAETEESEEQETPEEEAEETEKQTDIAFKGFYKEAFEVFGISQKEAAKELKAWADKNGYTGKKEVVIGHTLTADLAEGKYSVDFQMYQKGGGNGIGMAIGERVFAMDYYTEDGAVYFH